MEKDLDITKPRYSETFCQSLGPSLYRGSTVTRGDFPIYSILGPGVKIKSDPENWKTGFYTGLK